MALANGWHFAEVELQRPKNQVEIYQASLVADTRALNNMLVAGKLN